MAVAYFKETPAKFYDLVGAFLAENPTQFEFILIEPVIKSEVYWFDLPMRTEYKPGVRSDSRMIHFQLKDRATKENWLIVVTLLSDRLSRVALDGGSHNPADRWGALGAFFRGLPGALWEDEKEPPKVRGAHELPDPALGDDPVDAKAKADAKYPKRGMYYTSEWWGVMCPWFKHYTESRDETFTVADFAKLAGVEKRQVQKMNAKCAGGSSV